MANPQQRARDPASRGVLSLEAVPGDLIDKKRDKRFRQKMAHAGDNPQAHARDVGGGVLAPRHRDQGIFGTVQHQRRGLDAAERSHPAGRGLNGYKLAR